MTIERIIRMVAGSFVLTSITLGATQSPLFIHANFLWLGIFVGANLLQSSLTQFCPLEIILKKLKSAK